MCKWLYLSGASWSYTTLLQVAVEPVQYNQFLCGCRSTRAGFLNLATIDVLDRIGLCPEGCVLCTVGCWVASLASCSGCQKHWPPPSSAHIQKCFPQGEVREEQLLLWWLVSVGVIKSFMKQTVVIVDNVWMQLRPLKYTFESIKMANLYVIYFPTVKKKSPDIARCLLGAKVVPGWEPLAWVVWSLTHQTQVWLLFYSFLLILCFSLRISEIFHHFIFLLFNLVRYI